MRKVFTLVQLLCFFFASAQDLNWNTVSYTTGSLSANFGLIGSPASTVTFTVTGNTNRIDANYPVKYIANPSGSANDCAVNCAVRSSVTFTTLSESVVYEFNFSPAVTGLSFRIYDIDGTNASSGDRAIVTAVNGTTAQNITMTTSSGPTITGSGTTSATATGTQGNTTDDFINVSIISGVTRLSVAYSNNPNNGSPGNRSFSIGNMSWSGVLPVKWVSFTGRKQINGSVLLNWVTASETNADKYIIEKSMDGQRFNPVSELPATGRNNINYYSFNDAGPIAGTVLYRIKQIDFDGKYDYSGIVMIKQQAGLQKSLVFPNPATDMLTITLPGNVQLKNVKVFDVNGRLVMDAVNTSNLLNIKRLSKGLYSLQAENTSGEIFSSYFIKQ